MWRLRRPLFLVGLAMLAGMAGVGVVFANTKLPEVQALAQSTYICASDAKPGQCTGQNAMAKIQGDDGDRVNVPLDAMPKVLVNAVVAMEDRDFFEHQGIDPVGIARALYHDVKGDSAAEQGGSTITQQYVKNVFLSPERALSRKIREAVLSVKLEQKMSKDQILEGYLNTIYFGRGAYGVGAASQAYFGKNVRDIGLPEAAYLAGLIRAPVLADASKHPDEAKRRRHTALVAMQDEGYITADQAKLADAVPFKEPYLRPASKVKLVNTVRATDKGTAYVTYYVQSELKRLGFSDKEIEGGGLRVYTSLNYTLQSAAWDAVASTLDRPEDPEAAMVAVDDQGLIRAMVGSRHPYTPSTKAKRGYEVNYAVRGSGSQGRQPGSTFKPVVLAEAMRRGYSLDSRYNAPGTIEFPDIITDGKPWKVSNYSDTEDLGVLNLLDATRQSSNTAFSQLMHDLGVNFGAGGLREGPAAVAALAEQMGVGGKAGISAADTVPSLVLGINNATPLEMAGVYSTFANRGEYKRPEIITRVERVDQEGNATVVYQRQVAEKRVLAQDVADKVTYALQGVLEPGSTGAGANLGKPAAGKTGTSQENRNAWFAGFVPKLTAVVWMGYPDADYLNPETGKKELWPMNSKGRLVHGRVATGGSFPAEIWKKFMEVATANTNDQFIQLTPEQISSGTVLNEGKLFTSDETTTTTPQLTLPTITLPNPRPGGGGGRSTTTLATTTTTTTTTTTEPPLTTLPTPGPP